VAAPEPRKHNRATVQTGGRRAGKRMSPRLEGEKSGGSSRFRSTGRKVLAASLGSLPRMLGLATTSRSLTVASACPPHRFPQHPFTFSEKSQPCWVHANCSAQSALWRVSFRSPPRSQSGSWPRALIRPTGNDLESSSGSGHRRFLHSRTAWRNTRRVTRCCRSMARGNPRLRRCACRASGPAVRWECSDDRSLRRAAVG